MCVQKLDRSMYAHAILGISEGLSSEFEQLDRDFSAEYQPSDNSDTEKCIATCFSHGCKCCR